MKSFRTFAAIAVAAALTAPVLADTSSFTIVNDATLDNAVAQTRADFLAKQPYTRLNATILVKQTDGSWRRGSYSPDELQYPASCVKLAYLASAMYWCRTNNHPYTYLDASVRPMIEVSDNVATGEVVDAITGAPNVTNPNKPGAPTFNDWYAKRLYTENYLVGRGLLDNQTILHKTYPSNSGSSPTGYEADAQTLRGGNRMQSLLSSSLMLEIIYGAIEPGANSYMKELLTHDPWGADSVVGFGLPPGSIYYNKLGVAYDTIEDIAYVKLPNGKEFILSVFTNGYVTSNPLPYDAASPGIFAEMLVERLGLDAGNPAKLKIDNAGAGFSTTGAWTVGTVQPDKFATSYAYATGGSGATATFALNVPTTGKYEVCVWYPQGTNRGTNVPFTVNHAGGAATTNVNQTVNGGLWVRLGDYNFNAGQGTVVVGTAGVASSAISVADAVKATLWPAAPVPPAAPSNLTATVISKSQINLGWTDNASDETNYVVERKTGSGAYGVIATLPAGSTAYNNIGLAANTSYTYRVKATNANGGSAYSNEATAKTLRR